MMKNGYGSSSIKFLGIYHPEKNHPKLVFGDWLPLGDFICLASASVLKGYDSPRLQTRGMLLQGNSERTRLEGLIFTNSLYFMSHMLNVWYIMVYLPTFGGFLGANVGKYSIHGAYGCGNPMP
jgi:hypothetical protein